jgi:hypothetical protein
MGRRMDLGVGAGGRKPETATELARKLPAPPAHPIADTPVLIGEEQDVFDRCEAAVENLKRAFWAAGKALHVIRDGRLYRGTHKTFEDYVEDRWDMQRAYANKLIRTWPIAEAMFEAQSNGLAPIGAKKLNQATMWELVPVADAHGVDAARVVYGAVLEVDGVPVTAEVINAAVKALPSKGKFDAKAATSAVRKAVEKMKAPLSPSVPRRRSTLPSQAKAARGASGLPWGSPEALDRLLREHMTPEDRAVLAKLLAVD